MRDEFIAAVERLTAAVPAPGLSTLLGALAVAWLLLLLPLTKGVSRQLLTIAHESGHAVAAVLTRRTVTRVHVRSDGSGTTYTLGRSSGLGAALVSFAGYPFPAILGAGLLVGVAYGQSRVLATLTALALLLLLLRMRNVHGWFVVALATAAAGATAWFLPDRWLAASIAGLGALLLLGSVADLLDERRGRRRGYANSDVSHLAQRGRLPAGAYWLAMLCCVIGCGWLAVATVTPAA